MPKRNKLRLLDLTAIWLVAIGGLNWGLDALGFNLIEALTDLVSVAWLSKTIYLAVGISGVWFGSRFLMKKIKVM